MNIGEFSELIGRLFLYLGGDPPTESQKKEWFWDVKHIPSEAIKPIWDQLRQRESISRRVNVPKAINEIYSQISSDKSTHDWTKYDPENDPRFPIAKLFQGLRILAEHGEAKFLAFCEVVGMPRNDRNAVRCKLKAIRSRDAGYLAIGAQAEKMAGGDREIGDGAKSLAEIIPF